MVADFQPLPEFLGPSSTAFGEPTTAAAAPLAVDQSSSLKFRHYALQRVRVITFPEGLYSNFLGRLPTVRVNRSELQHRYEYVLCPLAQRFFTQKDIVGLFASYSPQLCLGFGATYRLLGQSKYHDGFGPWMNTTTATRALEVVLIINRLTKCTRSHQAVTALALDHFVGDQGSILREQFEHGDNLIFFRAERTGKVGRTQRCWRAYIGNLRINLLDNAGQISVLTRYVFGFLKEHTVLLARRSVLES